MIEVDRLTKRFGSKRAVDDVSFMARPGLVTGFLGPNGSGKSTTMRLILGLDRPTSGRALIDGAPYRQLKDPLHRVGALLDAKAVHPGRTAYGHLRMLALTHGISRSRVEELIDLTGLSAVAYKRVGGFSLGMGQRLGIATALLGDPGVLVLDEPVNGLDPEGVQWIRELVGELATEGRTVLLSSHLMSEMALVADRVIVIGRGRIVADASLEELLTAPAVRVVAVGESGALAQLLVQRGARVDRGDGAELRVTGASLEAVGTAAAELGVALRELGQVVSTLEERYFELTADEVEYRSGSLRP